MILFLGMSLPESVTGNFETEEAQPGVGCVLLFVQNLF